MNFICTPVDLNNKKSMNRLERFRLDIANDEFLQFDQGAAQRRTLWILTRRQQFD